ncbi:putative Ig domain-containing protein [Candidatus Omnitrophota bacterium]
MAHGGTYTITPSKTGYTFTPPAVSFEKVTADVTQNFTAVLNLYTISGIVAGTDGVTLTLGGDASDILVVNDGESYSFTVAHGGTYTITPSKTGYTFTPPDVTFDALPGDAEQDFAAILNTYTISGIIMGADGVTVALGGDTADSLVVHGASYSFTVNHGGTYTVTPSKTGYTFTPSVVTYENVTADVMQNIDGVLNMYRISGIVTGSDGVMVTLSGDASDSQNVNSGESYSFTAAYGGTYTITPSKTGYTFSPPDVSFENVTSDATQDFSGVLNTYTISGVVTGADGVTVTLGGDASDNQVVNSDESFSFTVPQGGIYTVTPMKTGHTFTLPVATFENVTANATQDFAATEIITTSHPDAKVIILHNISNKEKTIVFQETNYPLNVLNGLSIYFPKEFITDEVTISLELPSCTSLDNENQNVSFSGNIITAVKFEVSIDENVITPVYFDKPIEVTIPYNNELINDMGIEPSDLGMFFVTQSGVLDDNGITDVIVDPAHNTITGMVAHFSEIAVAPEPPEQVTISGTVSGADSVTVTLSGSAMSSQTVNAGESYYFTVDYGGTFTVTPTKTGYTFTPSAVSLENVTADVMQDFDGVLNTYTISGIIMGADGVSVALGGDTADSLVVYGASYSFTVNHGGTYTVTPSKTGYTFTPSVVTFENVTADVMQNIDGVLNTYTITGIVTGTDGVTVALSGDTADSLVVNDGESYTFTVVHGGTYTVTPSKTGYTFIPPDVTFEKITADATQDFTDILNTYTISGIITGADGVKVVLGGDTADSLVVNDGDNYSFSVAHGGTYTITPTKTGYTFTPPDVTFEALPGDAEQDFAAVLNSYMISGVITGANSVTVTISGDTADSLVVNDGESYSFSVDHGGTYSITTSKTGYTFNPPDVTFEALPGDAEQDFAAVLNTYIISGTVAGANDMTVALSGDASDSVAVNIGDTYSFTVFYGGTYTLTASKTGHTITPDDVSYDYVTADITQDLTGVLNTYTISGSVTGADGVTVILDGYTSDSQVVDDGGSYSFTVIHGHNYSVTTSKAGYTFTPPEAIFENVTDDTEQDFQGVLNSFTVSGVVSGADSITVILDGNAADSQFVHDGDSYSFKIFYGDTYTITPAKDGYTFIPKSVTFEETTADVSQDFTSTMKTYTITGTVSGADSVTVVVEGDSQDSQVIKAGDSYSFTVGHGGSYTVKPSIAGYSFAPKAVPFVSVTSDMTQDFTAAKIAYTITGTVTGADGVTVSLDGESQDSQVVNDGEVYSFEVVHGGLYTVTPSKSGYSFTPKTVVFESVISDMQQDFNAVPDTYTISGVVSGADGITVTLSGASTGSQVINTGESYSFEVAHGSSYLVTPSKSGYTFNPQSVPFETVTADMQQDFNAVPDTYTISGVISGPDSVTVTLSGASTGSQVINAGEAYSFEVAHGGSYTVTPSKSGYTFNPQSVPFETVTADMQQDFNTVPDTYIITGTVSGADGVVVTLTGTSTGSQVINTGESYSFEVAHGSSYLVTPSKSGHTFNPQSVPFETVTADMQQDFNTVPDTYIITGTVSGADGVVVTLTGTSTGSQVINTGESYSFEVAHGSSYLVTPSKSGHTFNPQSVPFESVTSDIQQEFTAVPDTYTITGTVSSADGVTVTLSGASTGSQVINEGEAYSFEVAHGGSFTVTPSKSGFTFNPQSVPFESLTSDMQQDFSAVPDTYMITGTVSGADGVTVTLSGASTGSQIINEGEAYSFEIAHGGSYTVTPAKSGYTFNPQSVPFASVTTNMRQDFTAQMSQPAISSLSISPNVAVVSIGETTNFVIDAYDNNGKAIPENILANADIVWSVEGNVGNIINSSRKNSVFSASSAGTGSVRATLGNISAEASITVRGEEPQPERVIISGTVSGAHGVIIMLGGDATDSRVVNSGERYSFTVPFGGSYTVTPSKTGHTFNPPVMTFEGITSNITQNYEAEQKTYTISGTVTGTVGVTITLSGDSTDSRTINAGESYSFTVSHGGSYQVTSSKDGYTFTPESAPFTSVTADMEQDFEAVLNTYTISGKVAGADGVEVSLSGDTTDSRTVNAGERYSFTVSHGGSYQVISLKDGYTFTPESVPFTSVTADMEQDFEAVQNTYTISGTVIGTDGVTVSLSGDAVDSRTVNAGESYSFTVARGGSYIVTPSTDGYLFTPESVPFTSVTADMEQDFEAVLNTYTISGTVTGADEVTITLSGDTSTSLTVYTGESYSFTVADGGSYMITPSKDGYAFTPDSVPFTIVTADMNQDFEAVLNNYTISGTVSGTDEVTVSLSGDDADNLVVNSGESYSFSVSHDGSYMVIPSKDGYTFTPESVPFASVTTDVEQNFEAVRNTYKISGTVSGTDEVTVSLSGDDADSMTVNDGESYSFSVSHGGSYMVRPLKDGYTFTPESVPFTAMITDVEQDFEAVQNTYTISGTVSVADSVTVILGGDETDSLIVNAGESYSFTVAHGGTYTVTPSKPGYTFTPFDITFESMVTDMVMDFIADPIIKLIVVSPNEKHVTVGGSSVQFSAIVYNSEFNVVDIPVDWSVAGEKGIIDKKGLFTPTEAGAVQVIASVDDISGEASVTVHDIVVHPLDVKENESLVIFGIKYPLEFLNGMKLFFPEKSFSDDIRINFTLPEFGYIDNNDMKVSFIKDIVSAVSFEVTVNGKVVSTYYFDVPVEVTIPYKKEILDELGIEPEGLGMFFVDSSDNLVSEGMTDIEVDLAQNVVRGKVAHFSDIAVALKPADVTFNRSPVIIPIDNTSIYEGERFAQQIDADDENGDELIYSFIENPTDMSLSDNGEITWTPDYSMSGEHSVIIEVSDGKGGNDTESFMVSVTNVNRAPKLVTTKLQYAYEDVEYSVALHVEDTDVDDSVACKLLDCPEWLSITYDEDTSDWFLTGTPSNDDVGENISFSIKVTDSGSLTDEKIFTLAVINVNDAPLILNDTIPNAVQYEPFNYHIIAKDYDKGDNLTYELVDYPDWMTIDMKSGLISGTPGEHDVVTDALVKVRVSDSFSGTTVRDFTISIEEAFIEETVITLTSPNGKETLAPGLLHDITWECNNVSVVMLQYSMDGGENWLLIKDTIDASRNSYQWFVPEVPSSDCLVRIVDAESNNVSDLSDASFTLNGPPMVTAEIMSGIHSGTVDISTLASLSLCDSVCLSVRYFIDGEGKPASINTDIIPLGEKAGITWSSFEDIGYVYNKEIYLQLIPSNNFGAGKLYQTESFFVTNLVGDYDHNLLLDGSDLLTFLTTWNTQDTTKEIGPVSGEMPELQIEPDGKIDYEDLSVFAWMWNWCSRNPHKKIMPAYKSAVTDINTSSLLQLAVDKHGMIQVSCDKPIDYLNLVISGNDEISKSLTLSGSDYWDKNGKGVVLTRNYPDGLIELAAARFDSAHELMENSEYLASISIDDNFDRSAPVSVRYSARISGENDITTGVLTLSKEALEETLDEPADFTVFQNIPNPFNATTTITYRISYESTIKLTIYNMSGQLVAEYNEGLKAPGTYSVYWNADDKPSGVYFYTLNGSTAAETRKMLLVK